MGPGGANINTWNGYTKPNASLVIPTTVTHSGQTYTVTSIGKYAFANCTGLPIVTIPSSVKAIGDRAFYNCSNLRTINLPSTALMMGRDVLYGTRWYSMRASGVVLYIGNTLYGYKGSLSDYAVNIPSNIKSIVGGAFEGSNMVDAVLPNTIEYIGPHAFYNCGTIINSLPDSLKGIGNAAFYGCEFNISTLTIPNGMTEILDSTFQNCTGWTSVIIPNSVTKIRRVAFWGCSGVHSVTIGANVDSMMIQCMPWSSIQTVNYNAVDCKTANLGGLSIFVGSNLTSFNIGTGVQSLPDYLISSCGNLHSISLPNTVSSIGVGNFRQCGLSGTLSLPSSLTQIGSDAFAFCTRLTSIQCNATNPPTIFGGTSFFSNSHNTPLLVPCSSISAYQTAAGWSNFTNISGIGGCNYTVTLSVNNSTMGTVSGGGTYTQEATATISATANSGYHFDHWSDWNTQNPRTITVMQDITLTAYFAQDEVQTYTVTLDANNTSMGSVSGSGTYNAGSTVSISATAFSGYHFDHWSDGNTQNPRTITVNSNISLTAYFVRNTQTYTVTVNSNNSTMGSVSGGGTYEQGTTITITATANSGYHFDHWNDGNTQNPRTITVNGNVTLTAYFVQNTPTYTVTVNSNNSTMGSVSGGGTYEQGTTITIAATANSGYHFDHWSDGNTQSPRTITVNSNISLTAYFVQNTQTYTVTVIYDTLKGTVTGGGTYEQGTTITLTAIANSGYRFDHWTVWNEQENPRTITVNSDMTIYAWFIPIPPSYTVTGIANDTTMGYVSGGGTYEEGTVIHLTAIQNSGYHFVRWHTWDTQNPITVIVAINATFTAIFEQDTPTHTVTVNSNNTTMGTVSGGGTFEEGTTITLTATATDGYHFDHWSDGNTQNPRSITVNNDIALTAYFVQNTPTYTVTVNSNNTSMGTVTGGGTYEQGTTVQITATPYNGYQFDHWNDGNMQNHRTITVNSNITLTAYFVQNTQYHTVTLSSNDYSMGTVTGGGQYEHGSTATCAAVPYNGYHFERWSDNNTQNPRNITVNSNISLTAYFAANVGIDDIDDSGIIVYAKDYQILIEEAIGEPVTIYTIDGRAIALLPKATEHVAIPVSNIGIYIVKIGNHPARKVVVIR